MVLYQSFGGSGVQFWPYDTESQVIMCQSLVQSLVKTTFAAVFLQKSDLLVNFLAWKIRSVLMNAIQSIS